MKQYCEVIHAFLDSECGTGGGSTVINTEGVLSNLTFVNYSDCLALLETGTVKKDIVQIITDAHIEEPVVYLDQRTHDEIGIFM